MVDITLDFNSILGAIIIAAVTFALTFYLKEYLQSRQEYSSLKNKLEQVAGKNATVLYNPFPGTVSSFLSVNLFQIEEIGKHGITLVNDMMRIYVPAGKLLKSEFILPSKNYEQARRDKMKKDMNEMVDTLIPNLIQKMLPEIRDFIVDSVGDNDSQVSAVIGIKIQKVLEQEGFEIKKLPPKTDE